MLKHIKKKGCQTLEPIRTSENSPTNIRKKNKLSIPITTPPITSRNPAQNPVQFVYLIPCSALTNGPALCSSNQANTSSQTIDLSMFLQQQPTSTANTQETGSQTRDSNEPACLFEFNYATTTSSTMTSSPPPLQLDLYRNQYQGNQETQTFRTSTTSTGTSTLQINNEHEVYSDAATSTSPYRPFDIDISTQTQLSSFGNSYQMNETYQNYASMPFDPDRLMYLDSVLSQPSFNTNSRCSNNNNNRESMTTPQPSSIFMSNSCQTETSFYENITNSIQTQTNNNFLFNLNASNSSAVVDTITQTEWDFN